MKTTFDIALIDRMTQNTVAVASDIKPGSTLLIYSAEKDEVLKVTFSVLVQAIKTELAK